jgi:hypothetical protein
MSRRLTRHRMRGIDDEDTIGNVRSLVPKQPA